jgi:hypothetical protein
MRQIDRRRQDAFVSRVGWLESERFEVRLNQVGKKQVWER